MKKNILKLVVILVLVVAVVVSSVYFLTRRPKVSYQYDQIKTGKISETIKVSGSIKAAEDVNLSFEQPGKISNKYVSVGDQVKAGQVLLTLDNTDASAQLAQAQAALDKQLSGNRPEYIAQLAAAVDQAKASLNQVSAASDNSLHAAEALKLTAENNLKLAQGGESSQIVEDSYENMATLLQSVQNTLTNSLTKADNILGVDNTATNNNFKDLLSVKSPNQLNIAKDKYAQAKAAQQDFTLADSFSDSTNHGQVDAAISSANTALTATRDLLVSVSSVLDNTITGTNLSSSDLDALKTTIQGTRTDVTSKASSLASQKQAITSAKNSYTTYQIAADKANQDLEDLKNKTLADSAAAQASLNKAQAALADAKNPPREVDVASYRASVSLAAANYNKTILKAPFDGMVSRQDGKVGDLASPSLPLVSIVSNNKYQVEIYVAETDLPKIKVGNSAIITLDNLGASQEFPAQVIKIDPTATIAADGNSAYKVTLQFANEDERLKIGLGVNVKIVGEEKDNVLIISANDVVQKNGAYFVMVLNAQKTLEQKAIEIGLKGDNDQWEIISGLQAGDSVVSFAAANN